jgi:hypothetical protein
MRNTGDAVAACVTAHNDTILAVKTHTAGFGSQSYTGGHCVSFLTGLQQTPSLAPDSKPESQFPVHMTFKPFHIMIIHIIEFLRKLQLTCGLSRHSLVMTLRGHEERLLTGA